MRFASQVVPEAVFGNTTVLDLAERIRDRGGNHPIFIVSESVMTKCEESVRAAASAAGAGIITGVAQHLPYQRVLELADEIRRSESDTIVAIGGGSVLDAARLSGLAAALAVSSTDELHELRHRITDEGPTFAPPCEMVFMAVPTTLSAAELSPGVAATEPTGGAKHIFISPSFAFSTVLVDVNLSVTTPAQTWVTSGYRAIDHAVESLMSRNHRNDVDDMCLEALAELPEALTLTLSRPTDTSVRLDGHVAAWKSYAGVIHGTLGLSHAMGHQLGPALGISHGATSALTLPAVVEHYAENLTVRWGMFTEVLARSADAKEVATWLRRFAHDLGLATSIDAPLADTQRIAAAIVADPVAQGSPNPLPSVEAMSRMLAGLVSSS